jgi:hypothetical protein
LNFYNQVFYIIYNAYYSHGRHNKNHIPGLRVFGIFSVMFFCQALFVYGLIAVMRDRNTSMVGPNETGFRLLGLLSVLVTYFLFYYNKKYVAIYYQYKENSLANRTERKIAAWAFIILSILSPFIFLMIRNKLHFGFIGTIGA